MTEKRDHSWGNCFAPAVTKSILKAMKITTILLTVFCLQVSAGSVAQVSFSGKDVALEKVFAAIRKQSDFRIFFDRADLRDTRPVTVEVKSISVLALLDIVIKDQPIYYKLVGRNIFIGRKQEVVEKSQNSDKTLENQEQGLITIKGKLLNQKNEPVEGATIQVKGKNIATTSNAKGEFELYNVEEKATLIISSINYQPIEIKVNGRSEINVKLEIKSMDLEEVNVTLPTGYQEISKERTTGSFVKINNELLNRRVSTNILERLEGITSGLLYMSPDGSKGYEKISIRGRSTLLGPPSGEPLIVVDNFPYEGNINNLNPNDVESITVLRDAAAASIYGSRSGNGVIVITTKKGKLNQKLRVDVNANVTVINKPDLFDNRNYLDSKNYLEIENSLFSKGYYDSYIDDQISMPPLSPAIELLLQQRKGLLNEAELNKLLDSLRNIDTRNEFSKYVYRRGINQQYSINLSGGNEKAAYNLSIGFDKSSSNFIKDDSRRITLNLQNTYRPIKQLEISSGIIFSDNSADLNNRITFGSVGVGGYYGNFLYPYARLKDQQGTNLPIIKDFRSNFVDSVTQLGYLNWKYKPLDEIENSNNTSKSSNLIIRLSAKYNILNDLSFEVLFQNERQNSSTKDLSNIYSYRTRNEINRFSVRNPDGSFKYIVPKGGMLTLTNSELNATSLRGQINFNRQIANKHSVAALLGTEIRERVSEEYSRLSYGYDDEFGTSVSNLDYSTFYSLYPTGSSTISAPPSGVTGITNRYFSYYGNAAYSFNQTYTISVSARRDGANIFGVNANQKITPLWSTGLRWNISKESFFNSRLFSGLALRLTYGYNGNVYNGSSAYLTARYRSVGDPLTGLPFADIVLPPNKDIKWERVRNLNLGIDFDLWNQRINGSIEAYKREGIDLIESLPLAPQSGFSSVLANAARTTSKGIDITLNTLNITSNKFKWNTTLLVSMVYEKLNEFSTIIPSNSLLASSGGLIPVIGRPLFALYSYEWAGIDPQSGDPLGYVNKSVSKDYQQIVNNTSPDSLKYVGPGRPTQFGSLRNTISIGNLSVSFNLIYKLGYYYRKNSVSLNYQDLVNKVHTDYSKRWLKPGDEISSSVPSILYPEPGIDVVNRNTFYQYSDILVEKADHIRFQDVSLNYNLSENIIARSPFRFAQLYFYMNNIGIIWRANKSAIDPDYMDMRSPKTFSVGVKLGLK